MKQFITALPFFLLLISCGGISQRENISDSSGINSPDTARGMDVIRTVVTVSNQDFSFLEILKQLPENEHNLKYDEPFFDDYSVLQKSKTTMTGKFCDLKMLPDSIACIDSAYFGWKMTMEKFTLVNLLTIEWNPKGPCTMYHLITVDNKNGKLVDCLPEWAASYSVSVENPNGGTSAGVEYTTASLETNPVLTIFRVPRESDSDEADAYELSPDGHFVAPYARFEAETNLQ